MSMSVVRVLSIALTQSDRLLLSRLASIETLGYYSLALTVLRGLPLVQRFVTSALFPSFAANSVRDATDKLVSDDLDHRTEPFGQPFRHDLGEGQLLTCAGAGSGAPS